MLMTIGTRLKRKTSGSSLRGKELGLTWTAVEQATEKLTP